jgi:outer membrane protein TolC
VLEAERLLQQATFELSLFYRDAQGQPVRVEQDRLPPAFPATKSLDEQRLQDDIELAWKRRPEVMRFAVQREQVEVDRRLARNQLLPGIDFAMGYTRQSGDEVVRRGPDELTAGVIFDLALQRRQAKGREQSAVARIEQFDLRERFARDQVAVEVRDAYSAVQAAHQRAVLLRQEVELALELENAERVRFGLGDGTLFVVNLREAQTFDTAIREVGAVNEYFRALAAYEFAIAEAVNKRYGQAQP